MKKYLHNLLKQLEQRTKTGGQATRIYIVEVYRILVSSLLVLTLIDILFALLFVFVIYLVAGLILNFPVCFLLL